MSHLIAITREYLNKYPTIAAYIEERPELTGWVLIDDYQPCSLVITSPNRIHYIHTPAEHRRGGYASQLLSLLIAQQHLQSPIRTSIPKSDTNALSLFLKADFQITGFKCGTKIPSYVLEYVKPELLVQHNDTICIDKDCEELLNKLHVVEALPIYL